jgi:hypothetical protein
MSLVRSPLAAMFKCKVFETDGLDGIYHVLFDPTMRRCPRLRIFLAPYLMIAGWVGDLSRHNSFGIIGLGGLGA